MRIILSLYSPCKKGYSSIEYISCAVVFLEFYTSCKVEDEKRELRSLRFFDLGFCVGLDFFHFLDDAYSR